MVDRNGLSAVRERQLWQLPETTTSTSYSAHCTPFTLPSGGILSVALNSVITLTTDIVFQPQCTGGPSEGVATIDEVKDPFYASTTPQTYVIAATTVISWVLVVMLVITPRTTFIGNPSATPGFSTGHGIIGGATGGGTNMIGVGSRPWLQKAAALTVAIALTIATADTFREAQKQYEEGYTNANVLREAVLGSLELRITRVVSDVFVWLAQVQTLIRLFPRHKEKVLIKWIGFALIIFDSTFSCLNSFLVDNPNRPGHFVDAIPALSYLFELALSLLYAAWVLYYAMTKRRYSFYHSKMRSIMLIAFLSIIAIMTPVVFFVTDVSNQDVAGWGDYFRWVGAAAASVVVWEWVERIEALERDEKKDGILGREIFDGDEMLDTTPSEEAVLSSRHGRNRFRRGGGGGESGAAANATSALESGLQGMAQRFRRTHRAAAQHFPLGRAHSSTTSGATPDPNNAINGKGRTVAFDRLPRPSDRHSSQIPILGQPTPPPPVASPVSRADTTSAASTVYVVRYDTAVDGPQPVRRRVERDANGNTAAIVEAVRRQSMAGRDPEKEDYAEEKKVHERRKDAAGRWLSVANPFKRKRASPPAEVQQARAAAEDPAAARARAATPVHNFSRWDVKNRLGVLAAHAGEGFRDRAERRQPEPVEHPVTIILAPGRGAGRTWSPEVMLGQQQQQAQLGTADLISPTTAIASPARNDDSSPLGAGGAASPTIILAPSRGSNPPRADEISSASSSRGATTVIPAPRRSPLHIMTTPEAGDAGDAGDGPESSTARSPEAG